VNRQAQAAVLFLLGVAVLKAGLTDLYLRYVKAGLQPLLLGCGVILIVAAGATVWYEPRGRGAGTAGRDAGAGGRAGAAPPRGGAGPGPRTSDAAEAEHHHEPRVSWLLVLPLLALILVAPPALGSYSALRTGTALQQPWGFPTLPPADPHPRTSLDYAGRAVYDKGHSLAGRRIVISGFITLDGNGTPYLTRMVLNCCAADAQPIKIGLTGQLPADLKPDNWLEVTGTYTGKRTRDAINGGPVPYIAVSSSRTVPAPHDPYES
jgi:putative membrane protein